MIRSVLLALVALAVCAGIGVYAAENEVTLEGTLVDSKCYLMDNRNAGNDHGPMDGCGTMCMKGGIPGGLVTKDKKFYAIIAPAQNLADYVGQPVRVRGTLHNGSILASKVEVKKAGKWVEIKLQSMM